MNGMDSKTDAIYLDSPRSMTDCSCSGFHDGVYFGCADAGRVQGGWMIVAISYPFAPAAEIESVM